METSDPDIITLPYKIQIFVPEHLRKTLKKLARDEDTSLQKLVLAILSVATNDAAGAIRPAMRKHLAKMS